MPRRWYWTASTSNGALAMSPSRTSWTRMYHRGNTRWRVLARDHILRRNSKRHGTQRLTGTLILTELTRRFRKTMWIRLLTRCWRDDRSGLAHAGRVSEPEKRCPPEVEAKPKPMLLLARHRSSRHAGRPQHAADIQPELGRARTPAQQCRSRRTAPPPPRAATPQQLNVGEVTRGPPAAVIGPVCVR